MIRQHGSLGLRYLLLPFTVALVAAVHHAQNLPDLIENIRPSVVYIATFDAAGKPIMRGTGFALESNRVITNYHVIGGASRIEVRTAGREVFVATSVSASNKDADLAVLQLGGEAGLRPIAISTLSPRVGTKIFVLGAPLGLTGTVSDGIVSALRSHPKFGKLIQITAPISAGSSGSPVVNLDGEVVGLVTMDIEGGQNLNFAIASEQLLSFWTPAAGSPRKGLPGTSAAKRWRLLDTNMSYDTETFSKKAGIASSWIRYDKPGGTYSKVLMEVNCNTSRIKEVRSLYYRNTTEPPSETIGKDEWAPIVPESKGEVAYEVFCKDKPDYQSSVDYSRYSELYRKGLDFQMSKKPDDAIGTYSQIIKELPDYAAWAYNAIAAIKLGQGKTGEARTAVLKAVILEPKEPDYVATLGDVYKKEGNTTQAIETYWKSLKLIDTFAIFLGKDTFPTGAVTELAEIYTEQKNTQELIRLYVFANQGGATYFKELADLYDARKMAALAKATREKGIKHYQLEIKNRTGDPFLLDYWSLTELMEDGNDPRIERTVRGAMELFPSDWLIVDRLAKSFNKRKEWQKSIQLITEALPRMKDNSSKRLLLYTLRTAYSGQGDKDEAKRTDAEISRLP